jgi:hypothetical protein
MLWFLRQQKECPIERSMFPEILTIDLRAAQKAPWPTRVKIALINSVCALVHLIGGQDASVICILQSSARAPGEPRVRIKLSCTSTNHSVPFSFVRCLAGNVGAQ